QHARPDERAQAAGHEKRLTRVRPTKGRLAHAWGRPSLSAVSSGADAAPRASSSRSASSFSAPRASFGRRTLFTKTSAALYELRTSGALAAYAKPRRRASSAKRSNVLGST